MRFGSNVLVALLASFGLLACKGAQSEVKAPETNPWADYKGTYAPGGPQDEPPAETKPRSIAAASTTTTADDRPVKATGSKPKKTGAARPPKTVAADSTTPTATATPTPTPSPPTVAETKASPDDARSMYGIESEPAAEDAAAAPPRKGPKKRAAGGKKPGGKKTTARK